MDTSRSDGTGPRSGREGGRRDRSGDAVVCRPAWWGSHRSGCFRLLFGAILAAAFLVILPPAEATLSNEQFISIFAERAAIAERIGEEILSKGLPNAATLRSLVVADRAALREFEQADTGDRAIDEAAKLAIVTAVEGEIRDTESLLADQITPQAWAQRLTDGNASLEKQIAALSAVGEDSASGESWYSFIDEWPGPLSEVWFWLLVFFGPLVPIAIFVVYGIGRGFGVAFALITRRDRR